MADEARQADVSGKNITVLKSGAAYDTHIGVWRVEGSIIPTHMLNFATDVTVTVSDGKNTRQVPLGEYLQATVDSLLSDAAKSDLLNLETFKKFFDEAASLGLTKFSTGHEWPRNEGCPRIQMRTLSAAECETRGIRVTRIDEEEVLNHAARGAAQHLGAASKQVLEALTSIYNRQLQADSITHANDYAKMLEQFHKETARTKLVNEINAIEDPTMKATMRARYERAFKEHLV